MKILLCILIGYLVGTLNPAALISKIKQKNLREHGTGNLGATNTMLVFGKAFGGLVLLLDILKSFAVYRFTSLLVPTPSWLAMASGLAAVLGHCFPFYLKFKGGKGLAAFAGLVLAYRPSLFLFLLVTGVLLMLLVNYSFILPFYAAAFFCAYTAVREGIGMSFALSTLAALLIIVMHFGNFLRARKGEDNKIREYLQGKRLHSGNPR